MPTARATACAISISDETMKSTSNWPWRQASRYSALCVRAITRPLHSERACSAATMLTSSRSVDAITRSVPRMPARTRTAREAPLPSTVRMSYR